ncbi:MAG: anthranilate synthase component [Clostridia bacterium]|nr:anthranilate synthase component [Clostridia bacterium]
MQLGLEAFPEQTCAYVLAPVWEETLADTETPISLYLRFAYGSPGSFLLESVEGGERLGRYSIIGFDPILSFTSRGGITVIRGASGHEEFQFKGNPFDFLRQYLNRLTLASQEGLPRFSGGLVGYLGYDLVRFLERLPEKARDDLGLPDAYLFLNRFYLIYDHLRRTVKVLCLVHTTGGEEAYRAAALRVKAICREIAGGKTKPGLAQAGAMAHQAEAGIDPQFLMPHQEERGCCFNMTREEFIAKVRRIKEYIAAGDVLQVVLSQRMSVSFRGDTFKVYRNLRSLNPSPYMFYLNFPGVQLAGSSPEMLVRVENGEIENRPIAGTRPRGRNAEEDQALARELAANEKERAEHLMLVDLGRNDVGRVAQAGTVMVPQFMQIENYSHVMHLVSSVTGKLAPGKEALDALMACFPAGTVSGAPKVRAMEIIEELEPTRRGPYAGAVGYLGLNGNLDTCIAIRTLVFSGGQAYVQAGAGIVADSDPEAEYQETLHKAAALLQVMEEGDDNLARFEAGGYKRRAI